MAAAGDASSGRIKDHGPAFPRMALPPIDRLPGAGRSDVLADFVRERTRSWGGVPVPLSGRVAGALWSILGVSLLFGAWLLAVAAGLVPCSGVACSVATLGGDPVLPLLLVGTCAGALAVSVPVTRGLSRANGPQLALLVGGALSGAVAISGVLAVLVVVASGAFLVLGVIVHIVDRV